MEKKILNLLVAFENGEITLMEAHRQLLLLHSVMPSLPLEQLYDCEQCKNFYEPDESGVCPICGHVV